MGGAHWERSVKKEIVPRAASGSTHDHETVLCRFLPARPRVGLRNHDGAVRQRFLFRLLRRVGALSAGERRFGVRPRRAAVSSVRRGVVVRDAAVPVSLGLGRRNVGRRQRWWHEHGGRRGRWRVIGWRHGRRGGDGRRNCGGPGNRRRNSWRRGGRRRWRGHGVHDGGRGVLHRDAVLSDEQRLRHHHDQPQHPHLLRKAGLVVQPRELLCSLHLPNHQRLDSRLPVAGERRSGQCTVAPLVVECATCVGGSSSRSSVVPGA